MEGIFFKHKANLFRFSAIALMLIQVSITQAQGPGLDWTSHRLITLSTPTTLQDYQVKVEFTTAVLGSPYTDINSDGSDIRFYDEDDNKCAYWIEKWDNNGTSIIWVRIPKSGSNYFNFYYGNPTATGESSGDDTFDWFDDFEGNSLQANWSLFVTGSPGSIVTVNNGTVKIQNTNGNRIQISSGFTTASTAFFLESKFQTNGIHRNRFYASTDLNSSILDKRPDGIGFDMGYFSPSIFFNGFTGVTLNNNTDYITQFALTDNNQSNNFIWNTLTYPNYQTYISRSTQFDNDIRYVNIAVTEQANTATEVDWVRVRKRQSTEPVASVGAKTVLQITNLSSLSGCRGSVLTITGTFLQNTLPENVKIGGTPVLAIISNSATEIVVVVGNGTTGKVTITNSLGSVTSSETFTVNAGLMPDTYSVTGGGSNCDGVLVGLSNSQVGVNYQLFKNGSAVVPAQIIAGSGSSLDFGIQSESGTYTVLADGGSTVCTTLMDESAVVSIPPKIKINSGATEICQGNLVPLTASFASESATPGNKTASTNASVLIPDNNPTGTHRTVTISGIPANAMVTNVTLRFKITHSNLGDLVINLKGPNGNVLNIANGIGGNSGNFGTGSNYTSVDNVSSTSITTGSAPFISDIYSPQAAGGVAGATAIISNVSNAATFTDLFSISGSGANGNWVLSARDNQSGNEGTLDYFQIEVDYTSVSSPQSVTWSGASELFKDPGGTVPYDGSVLSTIYVKPVSSGVADYYATTVGNDCVTNASINVNESPVLTVTADYCNYAGVVRITAESSEAISTWIWSTGDAGVMVGNTSYIDVDESGTYYVSARASANTCASTSFMSIAQELVKNGDFEQGNTGFESEYYYQADLPGVNNELVNDTNPYNNGYGVGTNGQNYHSDFWGVDHTYGNGSGNFMIVNGHGNLIIWQNKNVTVLPNTTYYFSAWAMSLNNKGPFAELKFEIEGDGVYLDNFSAKLDEGKLDNSNNGWKRFYGTWTSGESTNLVNIKIVNLEGALGGNDFALDDISFATLSSFFTLKSPESTVSQLEVCQGSPIDDIIFDVGGDGNPPSIISGSLPSGLTTYWNGRTFRISGVATSTGNQKFTLESSGCNTSTKDVEINVIAASDAGSFDGGPIISDCYESSGEIIVNGTVGAIQWQTSDDGSVWTNVANGEYNNLQSTKFYRVIAQNTPACNEDISAPVKLTIKNLWTGKTNTDWANYNNWSDETYPLVPACDAVIPFLATARYPIMANVNATVNNLIIKPGAELTVNGTSMLTINGSLTSSGGLDATGGALQFSGNSGQMINSNMFKDHTVNKLIVSTQNNNSLTVDGTTPDPLIITGKISFGDSKSVLNTGDNITLRSTKAHTASVGIVGSDNVITGQISVERYINIGTGTGEHRKAWHVIAPNTSGQTIKQSWMENGDNSVVNYGINLTGAAGGGWDDESPAPAIKYYVPSSGQGSWAGAPNSSTLLDSKSAWMVFIRGDRSVIGQWDDPKPTTLRSKGTIKTGTQTITVPAIANGFYLIGNPYPSAVDVSKITTSDGAGILNFTLWNPNLGGSYGLGAYQEFTYNENTNQYESVPGPIVNNTIQSGQGFFVKTSGTAYDVIFKEDAKVDASNNTMFFRGNGEGSRQVGTLRSNVLSGDGTILDGTLQFFSDDYSNEVDMADGRKMMNTGINLSVKVSNDLLVVERRALLTMEDTIYYNLTGAANGKYTFSLEAAGLSASGLEGWLEDAFTGQRHAVNMEGLTNISFDITGAAASKAANRFRLVFRAALGPVPVTFVKINAVKDGNTVKVTWDVANEI
ncbi:MAG: DUF2341 domain-containing protein, partial [Chitinophagaceae bacterium]|nr:DUF2341 domain-containing protein [Chitinophagaceae bacterium]